MKRGFALAVFAAGLLISGCSLAGDVTPPPALATAQMAAPSIPPTPVPIIPPDTQPDLAAGERIYADKCAACHGPGGLGDGELANELAFAPPPLGDPQYASQADPLEWYRTVTIGNLDRLMPGFTSLTDQERWDVVGYALSLGAGTQSVVEVPEPVAPAELDVRLGSITGKVSNGSEGASLPDNLEISLFGYDGDQEVVRETVALASDGSYRFEDLEYVPGRLYFTTINHHGLTYRSDIAHSTSEGTPIDLPITIFETTNDSGALRVERLHLIVDFPAEDVMRVLELWVLANSSDRVLITPLQIPLPEGVSNLTFEDGSLGGRFEITSDGFVDLEPIPPGSGIDHLVFGFDLPISRSLQFDQLMRHPVDAVTVLLPAGGTRVSGLEDQGVQNMGGLQMQSFATGALAPEQPLSFRVTVPLTRSSPPLAGIGGAAVLMIAALIVARYWFEARRGTQEMASEDFVEAIARLDDDYEAGAISERDWGQQRDRLKRRALDQMERSHD